MRRLYLHIGAHKTGTTTLQRTLVENLGFLASNGIDYASSAFMPNLHPFVGHGAGISFLPSGFRVTNPEGMIHDLTAGTQPRVVASSENFSFFFDPVAIQDLATLLQPHFGQISIVTYLRRQDRHAISHHQEGAKPNRSPEGALWGHRAAALPNYSPSQDLYLDYAARLAPWAKAFGDANMIIRAYDRNTLKNGDIVSDFLSIFGLEADSLQSTKDRNLSLGAAQAKVGHLMAESGVGADVASSVLKAMPRTGRLRPSRAEAQQFLSRYVDGNRRLNERFHIAVTPDLFDADFSDYPEMAENDWTEETASEAIRALLPHLNGASPALTPVDLRSAAEALQKNKPEVALHFVLAALALRPSGPALKKLQHRLEERLAAESGGTGTAAD
jgi:hypothetical protein